ncbi:MAG: SMC-Scp complex subunit ScpB [Patescibacteria group bacterium]
MNDTQSQIESILFAASRPVKLGELVKTLGLGKTELLELLEKIKNEYSARGINLIEKDERYQLVTNPANGPAVGNFNSAELREKLTDASLETLAIILYKQPVSRAEIEAIRGVNSQYILRQLLIRGMVEKSTSSEDSRRYVYKTTLEFMTHLGITDMKNLPDFEMLTRAVSLPEEPPLPGKKSNDEELEKNENAPASQDEESGIKN